MDAMPDGTYSVFVIDAEEIDDLVVRLELTITSGEYKGEVVAVRASHLRGDPVSMLGLPGTLVVERGVPRVDLEP